MRIKLLLNSATLLVAGQVLGQELLSDAQSGSVYPMVITPTRLRQAMPDVPASITIITADTIRKYGLTSVVEALRLVPGMEVIRVSGNDYRVSYHGTNILTPHRMNVLVDGISVYRPAYSRVFWSQLPIAMDDIDRIEVTRSPNSASYGPNSMLAIINIISKHPNDIERGLVSTTVGSTGLANGTFRFGIAGDDTAIRVTVSGERDGGYDYLARSTPQQGHDSTRMNRFNVRSVTQIENTSTLDLQATYVQGVNEVPFAEAYQVSFPDGKIRDYYLGGTWTKQISPTHEMQLRFNHADFSTWQSWRTCMPTAFMMPEMFNLWRANKTYANTILAGQVPTGGTAADDALAAAALSAIQTLGARARQLTCVTPNQDLNENRSDIELQETYVFSDQLRVVGGIGARTQRGESQTIFGGKDSMSLYRLFMNAEYKPRDWARFNLGGYAEHDSLTGSTFSPRAALNVRASENQTFRFVLSRGTRSPDIYEQRANWSYALADMAPPLNGAISSVFFQSAISPGNLNPERIISREIGYLLMARKLGLMLDVKVFDDQLTELVSEKLQARTSGRRMAIRSNSAALRSKRIWKFLRLGRVS